MRFRDDTAATRHDDNVWRAPIRAGWDIRGNANGGYMMALAARTMAASVGRPDPITITAHYLAPGKVGDAWVNTRTIRAGRQLATVSATLRADSGPVLQLLGAFGDLDARDGFPLRMASGPPELPSPEQCVRVHSGNVVAPALFRDRSELLLHPEDAGFITGQRSSSGRIRGWWRLSDSEPLDVYALLVASDGFPPTIFNTDLPSGWSPTVELTVHVRARPADGWLRAHFDHRFASSGFVEENGELWDSRGVLVAQSRQLALLPRAPPVE